MVLLTAISVVGYATLNGQCPLTAGDTTGAGALASSCGGCPSAKKTTCTVSSTPCAATAAEPSPEDRAVVFILLEDGPSETSRQAAQMLESLTAKLVEANRAILFTNLRKGDRGFDQMVWQFSVESLPAVVTLSQGCKSTVVKTADIKEDALNRAFANASKDSGCGTTPTTRSAPKCGATCPRDTQPSKGN